MIVVKRSNVLTLHCRRKCVKKKKKDNRGGKLHGNEEMGAASGRLHNLIMSVGILTPFDDLVRRGDRGGGAEEKMCSLLCPQHHFNPPLTHPLLCSPHDREESMREKKKKKKGEVSVFNLEGSQMREILYAIWVTVCLTG